MTLAIGDLIAISYDHSRYSLKAKVVNVYPGERYGLQVFHGWWNDFEVLTLDELKLLKFVKLPAQQSFWQRLFRRK